MVWALLAACAPSADDGPKAEVVFDAAGSGEANAEPLWPVRPGWFSRTEMLFRRGKATAVLDARVIDGRVVLPVGETRPPSAILNESAPSEPFAYEALAVDDQGVWLARRPREGSLGRGALLLPKTVRVGMRWTTSLDGAARLTVEVKARVVEPTPFGDRPVWTVELEDHRRFTYDPLQPFTSPRQNGVKTELRFVEGRGPVDYEDVALAQGDLPRKEPSTRLHMIVPLEEPVVEPARAPGVELRPIEGAGPGATRFLPVAAGAYPDPTRPGTQVISVRGYGLFFGYSSTGNAGGSGWSAQEGLRCFRLTGDAVVPFSSEEAPTCMPPDGSLATPDGRVVALPYFESGLSPFPQACIYRECARRTYHFRGLVHGAAGEPLALSWGPSLLVGVGIGRYDPSFYADGALEYPDGFTSYRTFMPFLGPRFETVEPFWWTRRLGADVVVVDYGGGHRLPTGRMGFTRLGAGGAVHAPHIAFPAVESPSFVNRTDGRDYFLYGHEGLLRRVHLEAEGVALEPVAELRAPRGSFISAAFVLGDQVIALEQRGFEGTDPWYRPDGFDNAQLTTLGDVHVLRGKVPSSASRPARPSPVFGVDAEVFDNDVRVCFPPGYGAVNKASFTLGGRTPAAVLEEGACVLLVREPIASFGELANPSAWAVEGVIPGAGRVAVGLGRWHWEALRDPNNPGRLSIAGAPLAGGGAVSTRGVIGPGAISELLHEPAADFAGRLAHDAGGHGLWVYRPRWREHSVSLFGRSGELRIDLEPHLAGRAWGPRGTDPFPASPVALPGGGVLLGHLRIHPDGRVEALGEPTLTDAEATFASLTVTADGLRCGLLRDKTPSDEWVLRVACFAPGGAIARQGAPVPDPGLGSQVQILAQPDAIWIADRNRLLRVDLASLALAPVEPPGGSAFLASGTFIGRTDARGRLYFLTQPAPEAARLFRADGAQLTELSVPALSLFQGAVDVLVDEEVFVFVSPTPYNAMNVQLEDPTFASLFRVARRGQ